jgi:hypothetical protein
VLLATYLKSEVSWLPIDAVWAKTPLAQASNTRIGRTSAKWAHALLFMLETPTLRSTAPMARTGRINVYKLDAMKTAAGTKQTQAASAESVQNLEQWRRAFKFSNILGRYSPPWEVDVYLDGELGNQKTPASSAVPSLLGNPNNSVVTRRAKKNEMLSK